MTQTNQAIIESILEIAQTGPGVNGSDILIDRATNTVDQYTNGIYTGSIPLDSLATYLDQAGVLDAFLALDQDDVSVDKITWDAVSHVDSAFRVYKQSEEFMTDEDSKIATGWYDDLPITNLDVVIGSDEFESIEYMQNEFLPKFKLALEKAYTNADVTVSFDRNSAIKVVASKSDFDGDYVLDDEELASELKYVINNVYAKTMKNM